MPEYADTFVYHGGKVARYGSRIVSINHHGTVSLDGISYKTFKMPVNIEKDDSLVTLRQEWIVENYNSPMPTDIDTSSWTNTEWNNRMKAVFYRTSQPYKVNAQTPSGQDYFRTILANKFPVSIKLRDGHRIYNNSALNAIDYRYKASGWRVPSLEDYKNLALFWNYDSITSKASLASSLIAGCPDFNGSSFISYTFRRSESSGGVSGCPDGTIRAYGSSNSMVYIRETNLEDSPSRWIVYSGYAHLGQTDYSHPGNVWDGTASTSGTTTYQLGNGQLGYGRTWPTRSKNNNFEVFNSNYSQRVYNNGARLVLLDRDDGAWNGSVIRDSAAVRISAGVDVDNDILASSPTAESWNFPNFYSVRLVKNLQQPRRL